MIELWYALSALPPEGLDLVVEDQEIWRGPAEQFNLDCEITSPLHARALLLAQPEGCVVRGRIQGTVNLPCDRCAARAVVTVDQRFDSFEPLPGSGESDFDEAVMRLGASGPEINLAALLWQEFSLALPVHPLCRPDCAGLCPECGKDRNEGPCACSSEEGDPRLQALRGLKLSR